MTEEPKLGRNTGNAGKGRPKGSANKTTKTIKEAIEAAFTQAGGADYLARMAVEQPVAFMSLLGKIIPAQVAATVEGNVTFTEIRRVVVDGQQDA